MVELKKVIIFVKYTLRTDMYFSGTGAGIGRDVLLWSISEIAKQIAKQMAKQDNSAVLEKTMIR